MYVMGDQYMQVYEQMPPEIKAEFDTLPDDVQFGYIKFWVEGRTEKHAAHRDMLPAFRAGWDAGANDLLRRYNVRVMDIASDFFASLFEDRARPRRRRRSA